MPYRFGTQGYVWYQIYTEQLGKPLNRHLDEVLARVAESGCECWEQGIESPEHAAELRELLPRYNLAMPSMYAGCTLHEPETWRSQVDAVLSKARMVQPLGTRIVVCNPNPIEWGKKLDKSDDQLKVQAEALQELARRLSAEGFTLAYHTHDAEMRHDCRELRAMLDPTDPNDVGFCLDAHWVYRGAGNSQRVLHEILAKYAPRLKSVHLRQSHGGIWDEVFGEGDVDYGPLAETLRKLNFTGPLILEQCSEAGTPATLSPVERHRRSLAAARAIFADSR